MLIRILLVAAAAALCVLGSGWGLKQLSGRAGFQWNPDPISGLLTSFALGVHLNALIFLFCWTFVSPAHLFQTAAAVAMANVAIGIAGWAISKFSGPLKPTVWVQIIIGVAAGAACVWWFPSTLDSMQIQQLQQFVFGWSGGHVAAPTALMRLHHLMLGGMDIPAQAGFAGLMFMPALLQPDLPVATAASGMKVMLFGLAAIVSLYAARQFKFRPVIVAAVLILANMAFSQFGRYGLMQTGKDSVFAVLMAVASILSLRGSEEKSNEPGLFMSAAVLLGAASVPFLMLFWLIYFLVSLGTSIRQALRQAVWCVIPLTISVVGVHAVFAGPGSHHLTLLPLLAAEFILLATVWFALKKSGWTGFKGRLAWERGGAFLPLACTAAVVAFMPATGHVIVGLNGSVPITASPTPIDGIATASDLFYGLCPTNNVWLSTLALGLSVLLPIMSRRHRSPFFIALFSFLPATTALALLHIHLHLSILPDFNLWDIIKDSMQWYVGPLTAIFALLGLSEIVRLAKLKESAIQAATALACLVFAIGLEQNYKYFSWLFHLPRTITSAGGFTDPDTARAMEYVWKHGRGAHIYISKGSWFAENFSSFAMYGARQSLYFDGQTSGNQSGSAVYLTTTADAKSVVQLAKNGHASIDVTRTGDKGYAIEVRFDGLGKLTSNVPVTPDVALENGYDIENSQGINFRWAGPHDLLKAASIFAKDGDRYCPTIGLFYPGSPASLTITASSRNTTQAAILGASSTTMKPSRITLCAPFVDGVATINLDSDSPAQHFPKDGRAISFGMVWPPQNG